MKGETMNRNKSIASLILLAALTISAGCASRLFTPVFGDVPPGSTNQPPVVGYVVNTNAPAAIAAQTGQSVAPLLPPPLGPIVGGAGSLALAALGFWARLKSKQALQATDILTAVIAGVDAAGKTLPNQTAAVKQVKETIATHAAAAGYAKELDVIVQDVTRQSKQ